MDKSKLKIKNVKMPPVLMKDGDPQKVLDRGLSVLDRVGAKSWIAAGTLLGLHRDNGFIPFDTDIDVETTSTELGERIIVAMERDNFMLTRLLLYDEKLMQAAFVDTRNKGMIFDIQFFWEEGENDLSYYSDHGVLTMDRSLVEKIENHRPRNTEAYLLWRYGEDWRTPKTEKGAWEEETKCLT